MCEGRKLMPLRESLPIKQYESVFHLCKTLEHTVLGVHNLHYRNTRQHLPNFEYTEEMLNYCFMCVKPGIQSLDLI